MFQHVHLRRKSFSNSFVEDREENEDEIDSLLEDIDSAYQGEQKIEIRETSLLTEVTQIDKHAVEIFRAGMTYRHNAVMYVRI